MCCNATGYQINFPEGFKLVKPALISPSLSHTHRNSACSPTLCTVHHIPLHCGKKYNKDKFRNKHFTFTQMF